MITLKPHNLHWISGNGTTDADDLCAHGSVEFSVDDVVFIRPEDRDFNLTAAGLHLLKTLESDHTSETPVTTANLLFPCCGHAMYAHEGKLVIAGCPNGMEFDIVHDGNKVVITQESGKQGTISASEWKDAVFAFADQIQTFYNSQGAKNIPIDQAEREGLELFWNEWTRMRSDQGN